MRDLLDAGRETKRAPTWEAWEKGTDYFIRACDAVDLLHRRLEEGLAAAEREQTLRRQARTLRVQSLALGASAAVGVVAALLIDRVI